MQLRMRKNRLSIIKLFFTLLTFFIFSFSALSQDRKLDSLRSTIPTIKEDTNKVKAINDLAWGLFNSKTDTAIILGKQALRLAESLNWKFGMGGCNARLGTFYMTKNVFDSSLIYYQAALKIRESINDKVGMGNCVTNMAAMFYKKGDFAKAIECNFKGLKIDEERGYQVGVETKLGNIGILYMQLEQPKKALEYNIKALKKALELGDSLLIAKDYVNIGVVHLNLKERDKALDYYNKALRIYSSSGNKSAEGTILGNMGVIFYDESEPCIKQKDKPCIREMSNKALAYFFKALKICESIGDEDGAARNTGNIGATYLRLEEYAKAEPYLKRALGIDIKNGNVGGQKYRYEFLNKLYSETGRYELALQMYKKYISIRDSLFNDENTKRTLETQLQYEFGKKELASKAEQEKRNVLGEEEKQRQKMLIIAISCGLGLVLIIAVVIFRSLMQNRKKNKLITEQKLMAERQKELVEEKQREILDSIHYAQKIQRALITPEKYIENRLNRLQKS
jgi:tetratricopeptide (TPR) repeat protein